MSKDSDGLAGLNNSHFDIVLLDLGLPDTQGIDTLRKVHDKDPEAPIIVLTGLDDQEIATQAIRFGGQDYLIKGRQHPERGVLLPEQFFEAAEDIGLMPEIENGY